MKKIQNKNVLFCFSLAFNLTQNLCLSYYYRKCFAHFKNKQTGKNNYANLCLFIITPDDFKTRNKAEKKQKKTNNE